MAHQSKGSTEVQLDEPMSSIGVTHRNLSEEQMTSISPKYHLSMGNSSNAGNLEHTVQLKGSSTV